MNVHYLPTVVAGLLALQTGSDVGKAQNAPLSVPGALPVSTEVVQNLDSATTDDVLPVLSFATQNGLFSILPTGEARQEIMAGTDHLFFNLDWSADGNQVAVERNFGQVYITHIGQGTPTVVFESECLRPPTIDLAWQTNGETLLIEQVCDPPVSGVPGNLDIFLAQPTGPLQPLANLPETPQSGLYISPSATEVAYVADGHIYILSTDGTQPRQVTRTPGIYGAAGSPLAWSPDGNQIAFYEGNYPFQRINVINRDGSDRQVLTPDPNFQIYRSQLTWSPDSRNIAFYQPSNPPNSNREVIRLVEIDSGTLETLTRPGFYNALSWSPDSQKLAFASGSQLEQQAMFVYDRVTEDFTPLTTNLFQHVLASDWAPDGEWIAFTATPIGDEVGRQILYAVRSDASGFEALTTPEEYVYPFAWIPQP